MAIWLPYILYTNTLFHNSSYSISSKTYNLKKKTMYNVHTICKTPINFNNYNFNILYKSTRYGWPLMLKGNNKSTFANWQFLDMPICEPAKGNVTHTYLDQNFCTVFTPSSDSLFIYWRNSYSTFKLNTKLTPFFKDL